ncbi:MAG: hypothetical protein AAGA48_15960 [Myxococcota bacterium]
MTADEERRYFLVPNGTSLPEGDLEVRDLLFASKNVVAASIEAYEVDREAAQAHVDEGWGQVIGQARDAVRQFLGQPPSDDPPDVSLPFVGRTPGEVALDAEKLRSSGPGVFEALSRMVGGATDDDAFARFEERFSSLRENLVQDAGRAAADVSRVIDQGLKAFRRTTGVAEPDARDDESDDKGES